MPRLPPNGVAQSKPKKAFFAALDLVEGDGHSTKVYRQMQVSISSFVQSSAIIVELN